MQSGETCPRCHEAARRDKTLWSTNRPPVHVYVCQACQHTFLVHETRLELAALAAPAN
jgi:transposase-like protein